MKKQFSANFMLSGGANGIATGVNWARADLSSETGRKDVSAAISEYFKEVRAAQQKTNRPGHLGLLPSTNAELELNIYQNRQDVGIENVFRSVDRTSSKNPTFQFAHVNAGVVFEQREPGQPIKIRSVKDAAAQSVTSVTYNAGLGIDDEAARFDEYDIYEANVQAAPASWDDHKATLKGTLFQALGAGINQAFDGDLQTTLNNACSQIIDNCGDKYQLQDNPSFVLLHNHWQADAIIRALTAKLTLANDNNSATQVNFDIIPVSTRKIPSGTPYLCLPGHDMVSIDWDNLYSENGRDYARQVDAVVFGARHNAAIGNTDQVRRIALA